MQKTLNAFFRSTLNTSPSATAIIDGTQVYTYSEVNESIGHIVALLAKRSISTGQTVALCLDRSPELIISVLGIIEAGAAYVPIDPSYPADRIAMMLEDAKPGVVITSKEHEQLFKGTGAKILLIEELKLIGNEAPSTRSSS